MAAMADITVYDMPTSPPNLDGVGVFYISFCVIWTTLLLAGMTFCLVNRHIPILKVRGLPLSFSAIALLHIYWILGQITYPIGATVPTVLAYDIQYFAMGIYFPLGIALFQASNIRFLHVAKMQKQFLHPEIRAERKCNDAKSSCLCRLRTMDYMKRTLWLIGIGMLLQFIITVGMWLACKKYHPTYGISGTEIHGTTVQEQMVYLGRGWEWWPSLLWQVIWTWIAAPILIWRAWGIHDTLGWRTQTIACCLSGLHATPMYLIASYVPAFAKVNTYFPPSQWIHVSIMMWEIFTVFVPIFHVIRLWTLSKKATASKNKYNSASISMTMLNKSPSPSVGWNNRSSSTLGDKGEPVESFNECMVDRIYTMDALEHVLNQSPGQLQKFAALSDFSGENIAFLSEVALWKSYWPGSLDEKQLPDAFNQALRIYVNFISTQDAEFPLNISSQTLKLMQSVFEQPARSLFGEKSINTTSPFEADPFAHPQDFEGVQMSYDDRYTGDIPVGFDMAIFNNLQEEIKYLVLTNTWPKFVESMRRRSSDTERSDCTTQSEASLRSWISNQRLKLRLFL
ncbi:uncharacterized protein N7484_002028 [Penicillium longicatenatum]|uniref:uncharacterized protein n=1 Tax=Penicillium longicatenatum TaxID=1561947 RepID=UPI00254841CB|nr:uncharacterized protein N7484_002028 [Penicillium longicatenatum]KAJ5658379.1 hypothetical protein N7484_002028 [Penicillium longicatenatum]